MRSGVIPVLAIIYFGRRRQCLGGR
jgi:hypothetical protein